MQMIFIFIVTWVATLVISMVVIYCGYRLVLKGIQDYKNTLKERKKEKKRK